MICVTFDNKIFLNVLYGIRNHRIYDFFFLFVCVWGGGYEAQFSKMNNISDI